MFAEIFQKFFGNKNNSCETAKKRLKLALIYDNLEISDDVLKDLQRDIIDTISRYFEIDKDALQLDISKSGDLSALVFNTPILSAKHQAALDHV